MPASKTSALTELTTPASGDLIPIVDVSDSTQAASGTTKKIQRANLIPEFSPASSSGAGSISLYEDTDNGTNKATIKAAASMASDRVLTLPDATDTLVGKDTTDTLTNKTITSPTITNKTSTGTDSGTETLTNKTLTSPTITTPTIKTWDGWQSVTDSWSYASADSPTFTITVPSGAASLYGVGWRIKLTQTTSKYFIITAVADTVLTVYGGTDYTLANASISSIFVSPMKAPLGFPLDTTKWTVRVTDTADRNTTSPSASTWTNLNAAHTITIPIGVWAVSIQGRVGARKASTNFADARATLSTANNTQSDTDFTAAFYEENTNAAASHAIHGNFFRSKRLVLTSKTQYYLNAWTSLSSGNLLQIDGSTSTTIIEALSAYL